MSDLNNSSITVFGNLRKVLLWILDNNNNDKVAVYGNASFSKVGDPNVQTEKNTYTLTCESWGFKVLKMIVITDVASDEMYFMP